MVTGIWPGTSVVQVYVREKLAGFVWLKMTKSKSKENVSFPERKKSTWEQGKISSLSFSLNWGDLNNAMRNQQTNWQWVESRSGFFKQQLMNEPQVEMISYYCTAYSHACRETGTNKVEHMEQKEKKRRDKKRGRKLQILAILRVH